MTVYANEYNRKVTVCQNSVKTFRIFLIFSMGTIFRSRSSNMTLNFEIDDILINYSSIMTCCHLGVKRDGKILQCSTQGIFGSRSSNITLIFEIDDILINYPSIMTCCHFGVKRDGNALITVPVKIYTFKIVLIRLHHYGSLYAVHFRGRSYLKYCAFV